MYQVLFSELLSSGSTFIPGTLFKYSTQLNLDIEDLGLLSILFYYLSNNHDLSNISIEKIRHIIPDYSLSRLKKRIQHLIDLELVSITDNKTEKYINQIISVDPLFEKLEQLIIKEHPQIDPIKFKSQKLQTCEKELLSAKNEIILLNQQLKQFQELTRDFHAVEQNKTSLPDYSGYKEVEKYITNYTGTLLSSGMAQELKKWITDFKVDSKFLIAILELCFANNIQAPRTITKYIEDITEHNFHTLEQLEEYFKRFVESENTSASLTYSFDMELLELARYLNIDMKAEARRMLYYKWRNEWGFTHEIIMKAGEIMSTRVNQGGLEYMDRILSNWKQAGINSIEAVLKSQQEFQNTGSKSSNANYYSKPPTVNHTGRNKPDTPNNGSKLYIPPNLYKKQDD